MPSTHSAQSEATSLSDARASASASSAVGAPWLLAFSGSIAVVAALSFVLAPRPTALVTLFQGGVALPVAFALERRMGTGTLSKEHPLWSLAMQMMFVQIVALPAVIMLYPDRPELVPAALAAVAGAHFLPYSWLHSTPVYTWLAIALSLGSWALAGLVSDAPQRAVLIWWALCYAAAAVLLLREHRRRTAKP